MNNKARLLLSLATFLALIGSFPARSQTDGPVLIAMDNVPFKDAIRNLATQAGGNYTLDPRVEGKPVTVRLENMTAKEAMEHLLKEQGFTTVCSPATTVCRIVGTNLNVKPVSAEQVFGDTNAIGRVVFDDMPLEMALGNLARQARVEVELDSKLTKPTRTVQGAFVMPPHITVSARWSNLSAGQAIAALLDNYDLTATKDPSTGKVHVAPKEAPDTRATK